MLISPFNLHRKVKPDTPPPERLRISEFADSDFIKSRTLVSLIRGQFSRSVFQVCC